MTKSTILYSTLYKIDNDIHLNYNVIGDELYDKKRKVSKKH